ncbi:MAG: KpsF/GutQ family sugar-phosphate isomerase [Chlamydiia bacterium]|nr:KpsF/GutQ family sugar-phosphate isomerase [Chlamydiia bacterium]
MLKGLFQKQKELLNHFYTQLNYKECERIFYSLLESKGVLFFTGVGKSGFVAQKIAATLMSTGTKAFFLPPTDALHGDLGMVEKEDKIFILSKSGQTEELLQLLPPLRNKGVHTIALTSNNKSKLAASADDHVLLPCEQELCPFDLAPTTSTEVQLLFGDVLAMALMEAKGISLEEYASNHPGGSLGRKMTIKVKDLMLSEEKTPFCFPEDQLGDVLFEFSSKRCGCLIVIDHYKRLQGIFTDGDLRRALESKGEQVLQHKVGNLMTTSPKAIGLNFLACDAMKQMESDQKHPVMVLPVVENNQVRGVIKMHDLIQAGL